MSVNLIFKNVYENRTYFSTFLSNIPQNRVFFIKSEKKNLFSQSPNRKCRNFASVLESKFIV